jgi:hypothetical protein
MRYSEIAFKDPLDAFDEEKRAPDDRWPLSRFPKKVLPAGTVLHHGTDNPTDFEIPNGPCAWFTIDDGAAKEWAGWANQGDSYYKGRKRVLSYETTRDLTLYDITDARTYYELAFALTGDPEHGHMDVAAHLAETGAEGWMSDGPRGEIMIVNPEGAIRPI